MDFRILGPLEVFDGERRLALGGVKQRALLGFLLLHANEAVSSDRLVDELWGDEGLGEGSKALQVAVSRLRRVLEPGRAAGGESQVLVTRPPGYELRAEPGRLDVERFEALVAEGRAAFAAGDLGTASDVLREALGLWRGPPLADLTYESFAQVEIARLEELRLTALEERIEAELALGRHAELIPELEALRAKHPLRERLTRQLMLALYRTGRQPEALEACRTARDALVELGIELSSELRELERAILNQDSSLDLAEREVPSGRRPDDKVASGRAGLERKRVTVSSADRVGSGGAAISQREGAAATGVPGRALRTLVFTDIVGSTGHLARLGDAGWRDLLGRHDKLVRGLVAEHGGRVMGKAGDGFFIAFDEPRPALACAGAICSAVGELGLQLRVGLHTGECEPLEDTLVGMAVHVAARVSALAGPGQVLASRTVHDLMAGSELDLVDRGRHDLRGISGDWQLFALRAPGLEVEGPIAAEAEPVAVAEPADIFEAPAAGLIGRERELAELRRALTEALEGSGSLFLISGEPGVGKTRLADAVSAAAIERGARVLWGPCWEGGGAPAYWPWVQVLRGLAGAPQVGSEIQPAESGDHRFALFKAVTDFLREATAEAPLVVVLDDIHAADEPSLLLLDFLAHGLRDARILAIGTYRPLEVGASDVIGRLARDGRVLPLGGLDVTAVRRFVEERTGVDSGDLARAVHDATEGNPFFVEELVRLLAAERRLDQPVTGGLPVPDSVREAINRHLAPLPEETLEVLRLASVLGKEFTFAALERVSDLPPDRLLGILDRAIAAGLIAEVVTVLGRYRFVHALVRDVLYDGLGRSARVELHRGVAEGLDALYADDPEPHLAELAHHYLLAAPGGDLERAIDYTTRAGDRAMALLAFEEAVRHYRRALEALERRESADPVVRRDLLIELGAALRKAGDPVAAKEAFRDAAGLSRRLGDAEKQAQATLGFAGRYWTTGVVDESVIAMLEDALAALGDEDTLLRAALLARLSTEIYYATPRRRAEELSAEAVEVTRRLGDDGALASVLDARLGATWGPDNLDERLELSDEVVDLAERGGDKETALRVRAFHISCLLEAGDVAAADAELQSARQRAEYLRQPRYLWHVTGLRALRALMTGRLDDGERLMEEALEFGRHADERIARHVYAIQLTTLRYSQGRLEELEGTMRAFVDQYPHLHGWRSTLALLYAELGDLPRARSEFEQLAGGGWTEVARDSGWLLTTCRAADTCFKLGDRDAAALLYDQLRPFAGRNVVLGRVASIAIGSAARHLGQLAAVLERFDDAARHFEDAMRMNRSIGARPWLALSECDYAAVLRARGDDGRADELVGRARESGLGIVEMHAGG